MAKRPFLTAEWRHLILLTYSVEKEVLLPYLPEGLELDVYKGRYFASFVAFDFLNTKVKGFPIPFHRHFPEVNLRFYVRRKLEDGTYERGVVFVKELVPKRMVALIAKKVYNEPYEYTPMWSEVYSDEESEENNRFIIEHGMEYGGLEHHWRFIPTDEPFLPDENSTEHFFKEHEWGYGVDKRGRLLRYRVEHPVWKVYPLTERFELKVDFGILYGEQWSFLNHLIPYNILVAEGSAIKVFPGELL